MNKKERDEFFEKYAESLAPIVGKNIEICAYAESAPINCDVCPMQCSDNCEEKLEQEAVKWLRKKKLEKLLK